MQIKYNSLSAVADLAIENNMSIAELVIKEQAESMGLSEAEIKAKMLERYNIMKKAKAEGLKEGLVSVSGLTGGDAFKLYKYRENGINICGNIFTKGLSYALAVNEYNAAMGKIVATPTAGSCGILPAAMITMQEEHGFCDEEIVEAMFTASAVGMVVATIANVSGAEGGCQAECGSAAAMSAAAICELFKAGPKACINAVAITFKNVLGLVCDPVAGLVEVPCVKRNASGVATAFMAAQLAISGIESKIPVDETILTMKSVGDKMCSSLKETAEGGLAVTPCGCALSKKLMV